MNFDLFGQIQEKLGRQVFKLSVLKDLTLGVETQDKDYWRSKWIYFNPNRLAVKYGKDKSFPVADLRRAWRTDNQNFFYITEDKYGKTRCLRFGVGVESGVDKTVLDVMQEAKDIKTYNSGQAGSISMIAIVLCIVGAVAGVAIGIIIGPSVMGAIHG